MNEPSLKAGFTLLEIIITLAVISLIAGGTFVIFSSFMTNTYLEDTTQEIVHALRKANTNATARLYDLRWGVYFDDTALSFTFFAGDSYATRSTQYDEVTNLPTSVTFGPISLNGGGKEIVFTKIVGGTTQYGSLEMRNTNSKQHTLNINQLGQIEVN